MSESLRIQKTLVANRGEIAICMMRAAAEMGMRTVAIYAHEERFSLHRFKADESYLVDKGDPLVTLEAMKMETAVTASLDGVIDDVYMAAGMAVEARELLISYCCNASVPN